METILLSKYSSSSFTQAFLAVLITVYLLMATNAPARVWFGSFQMLVSIAVMVAITQFACTFRGGESSSQSKRAVVAALIGLPAVAGTR
jgi:membrane-bound metal-dependent hydrolase YbcI (DUF457 family)